jgi:hypothetical protein
MIGTVTRNRLFGIGIVLWALGLSACSSSTPTDGGTLKGRLMEEAASGLPRSAEGTITVAGNGISKSLRVGSTGLFTFALPSGTYKVLGSVAHKVVPCSTKPIGPELKVVPQRTTDVQVICSAKLYP